MLVIFRGFVFLIIVLMYSAGVWKVVDDYFRKEFTTYITKEMEQNEHMKNDFKTIPYENKQPREVNEKTDKTTPNKQSGSSGEKNGMYSATRTKYEPEYATTDVLGDPQQEYCENLHYQDKCAIP